MLSAELKPSTVIQCSQYTTPLDHRGPIRDTKNHFLPENIKGVPSYPREAKCEKGDGGGEGIANTAVIRGSS